eukprot:616565-Prymnesium_polylepis.1
MTLARKRAARVGRHRRARAALRARGARRVHAAQPQTRRASDGRPRPWGRNVLLDVPQGGLAPLAWGVLNTAASCCVVIEQSSGVRSLALQRTIQSRHRAPRTARWSGAVRLRMARGAQRHVVRARPE